MNRLDEFIKKSGMTVQEVADAAGYTRDTINRIKAGKVKLNEDNIYRFSKIFNCYPSELLNIDWQKPLSTELNPDILSESIKIIFEAVKDEESTESLLDFQGQCKAIARLYNKKIRESKNLQPNVVNIHKEVDN